MSKRIPVGNGREPPVLQQNNSSELVKENFSYPSLHWRMFWLVAWAAFCFSSQIHPNKMNVVWWQTRISAQEKKKERFLDSFQSEISNYLISVEFLRWCVWSTFLNCAKFAFIKAHSTLFFASPYYLTLHLASVSKFASKSLFLYTFACLIIQYTACCCYI